ncbi:MAG: hypothetical protein ABI995_02890 [Acidobacteriota bacterium]
MTTLQQALHIFRKDAREFRMEIAAVLILTLFFILLSTQSWESLQNRGGPDSHDEFGVLLPIVWCLLIARVIQAEALPGDRHFWLTRPYQRAGLVLSKALFIAAFVNIPLVLAQALIVSLDGLPLFANLAGLLWNQVLITAILILPAAAAAALTRNLAQFFPVALLTAALMAGPSGGGNLQALGALEWIRSSLGLILAVSITAVVVWRQYRLRKTTNTGFLAVIATLVGIVLFLGFPQSVAYAIQSSLLSPRDGQFSLRLGQPVPVTPNSKTPPNRYRQRLKLPLLVTGADPRDLQMESSSISFRTLAGVKRQVGSRATLTPAGLELTAFVDREFFNAAKNSPVTLHGEYYFTQFGNPRSAEVPLDGTPVYVPLVGQCGTVPNYDRQRFVCREPFRRPRPFLSDRVGTFDGSGRYDGWMHWGSYSPFPAQITLSPVFAESYQLTAEAIAEVAPQAPARPANLVVRDPVAYFRYTLEIPNVRLADFAVPEEQKDADQ